VAQSYRIYTRVSPIIWSDSFARPQEYRTRIRERQLSKVVPPTVAPISRGPRGQVFVRGVVDRLYRGRPRPHFRRLPGRIPGSATEKMTLASYRDAVNAPCAFFLVVQRLRRPRWMKPAEGAWAFRPMSRCRVRSWPSGPGFLCRLFVLLSLQSSFFSVQLKRSQCERAASVWPHRRWPSRRDRRIIAPDEIRGKQPKMRFASWRDAVNLPCAFFLAQCSQPTPCEPPRASAPPQVGHACTALPILPFILPFVSPNVYTERICKT
jgi:hypothetical protein